MSILGIIAAGAASVFKDRLLTRSSIDGALVTAAAGAGAIEGIPGIEPGTPEHYIIVIIMAGVGLYRLWKKSK